MTECPICADPAADDVALCPGCGWQLRAGPFLGWADSVQLAEFEHRLERVAAEWDLAAAARSGATLAETPTLEVRGGAPTEAAWGAAKAELGAIDATAQPTNGALLGVLTRLTNRTTPVIHFIGMSYEHIGHQRIVADPIGFPALDGVVTKVDWATATISTDPVLRRFQLAGGVGPKPVNRQDFDRAIEQALSRLDDGECVLIGPGRGWKMLDRAQDVLRRHAQVKATILAGPDPFDLVKIVTAVLRTAPLPCDYEVLLQRVDPASGAVGLVTRRLFPVGTRVDPRGTPPTHRLTVHGSPVGNDAAGIPVVARDGQEPADWRILALGRTNLPPRSTARVEFKLEALTEVRVSRDDGVPVSFFGGARLRDLLAAVPQRVSPPPPLDVVCAVELCGTEDKVRGRLKFVESLIEVVIARHPQPGQVRFGAIAYLDHRDRPTALYASNRVVYGGEEPSSAESIQSVLRRWRPHAPLRDAATAMEDALAKAAGLRWHRSAAADRVLVLVGQRPPSVSRGSGPIAACPHRMDWRESVRRLRSRRVRIIGVQEPGPVTTVGGSVGEAIRAYADRTWHELAGQDRFTLGSETADAVSNTVTQRYDLPPDAFPLGLAAPLGANVTYRESEPATA